MAEPGQDSHSFYSAYPNVHLEILRGRARIRTRPVLAPVYLIGRAADCDLVLGDPEFPDLHTYLFVTQDRVTARHLGAEPPLEVGGMSAESVSLEDRDVLKLGRYEFQIRIEFPPATREPVDARPNRPGRMPPAEKAGEALESNLLASRQSAPRSGPELRIYLGPCAADYVQRKFSA